MRRAASAIFVIAALGFLVYLVFGNLTALREQEWRVRPALLLLSIGLNAAGLFLGVKVWHLLLIRIGYRTGFLELARVWFVSGLGRYIPGKIWQFVGAAHLGGAAGLPAAVTVTSLAVHTGVFMVGALLTTVYLFPAPAAASAGLALDTLRWIAPLVVFLLHPRLIDWAAGVIGRVTRRPTLRWTGTWWDAMLLVAASSVVWALTGAAFYLFALSLTDVPGTSLGEMIAINSAAFLIGYAAFFVPAGLGAKEGALAALLTLYVGASAAALIALAARLWMIAAEVLPALILLRTRPVERIAAVESEESDRGR